MENKDKTKAEKKLLEEAFSESEEKFRVLVQESPVIIYQTDKDGKCIFANQNWYKMTCLTVEETMGDGWVNGLHDEDRALVFQHWQKMVESKGKWGLEYRLKNKEGKVIWIYGTASSIYNEKGEISGYVGINTDITDLKQAQEELKFRSGITEQVNASVISTGLDFKINWVNNAFSALYGYSSDEAIGKAPDFVNIEPLAEEIQNDIYQTVSSGEVWAGEVMNRRKDGTIFLCELDIFSLKDENGDIFAYIGHQRDITNRKNAEDELLKARNELELHVKERTVELQEKNVALKVLLTQQEEVKNDLEQNILSNIKSLIQPYIQKLKRNNSSSVDISYLNLMESNLKDIVSPFSQKLSSTYMNFTSREIEMANLIKEGKKDKEIMEIMNIAFDTVKAHRKNIRKKLGITGKGTNLRNKLLSI